MNHKFRHNIVNDMAKFMINNRRDACMKKLTSIRSHYHLLIRMHILTTWLTIWK